MHSFTLLPHHCRFDKIIIMATAAVTTRFTLFSKVACFWWTGPIQIYLTIIGIVYKFDTLTSTTSIGLMYAQDVSPGYKANSMRLHKYTNDYQHFSSQIMLRLTG